MERLGQGTGSGVLIQAAGSGQFGTGIEDAGSDEGADEIAFWAMSAGEQVVQAEMAKGAEDRGDMAMRKRAEDLKGLFAGDQIFPLQDAAQEIDLRSGPGGDIGEGAFVDLGADPDGFAKKATDSTPDRSECWTSPGSQAAARWDRAMRNRRDPPWQPGWAKTAGIRPDGCRRAEPGGSPRGP